MAADADPWGHPSKKIEVLFFWENHEKMWEQYGEKPSKWRFSHGKSLNEHDVFDDFPSSIARSRGEGGAGPFSSRANFGNSKDKDQKLDIKEVVSLFFPDPRRVFRVWCAL